MEAIHTDHKDFKTLWQKGEKLSPGTTFFYTDAFHQWNQKIYSYQTDDTFVVVSPSKEILALVPLYTFQENGKTFYARGPGYMRAPLFFCPFSSNHFNRVATFVFEHIKECAQKHSVHAHRLGIEAIELLEGRLYFNVLMDYGYKPEYGVTNIIDTRLKPEELWTNLRKSYHRLINKAKKSFHVKIVDSQHFDFDLCEEYRKLHHLAAGRDTRPVESFHVMYAIIKENKAFLVLVFDADGKARGAHFFLYNGIYAYSGSAANDPSLDSLSGVGHLAVWEGVLCAQRLGCHFLDQGPLMHQRGEASSEKEINIDYFKQGFGGERVVIFRGILEF